MMALEPKQMTRLTVSGVRVLMKRVISALILPSITPQPRYNVSTGSLMGTEMGSGFVPVACPMISAILAEWPNLVK